MSMRRVMIRLSAPTLGVDPETGEVFESILHRVDAEQLFQNPANSTFVSGFGEVVAEWPTELIVSVKWGEPIEQSDFTPEQKAMPEQAPSPAKLKAQLEQWRSGLARIRNVRSSSILSNAAIAEISEARPRSLREVRDLQNICPNQFNRDAREIVQLVNDAFTTASASQESQDAYPEHRSSLSRDSIDSLSTAVSRRFGIRLSASGRFAMPGWFFVGTTVVDCPTCIGPLEGFRAPYTAGGKTYHYWALVCTTCATLLEPAKLDNSDRQALYASSELRPRPDE